ncbi:MAG TPA: sialidase family protein, partial [Blastocatellia bacterium]
DTNTFSQTWFIRSKKGTKFLKPVLLSEPGEGGFTPQVAVDTNGVVYVTWQASSSANGEQVVVETSTNLGVSFAPRVVLSGSSTTAEAPSIVTDSNNIIHVIWQDSSSGSTVILYSNSADGGNTFSTPVRISTGPGPDTQPQLGLDKLGGVNAIWVDQSGGPSAPTQIQISRSTDGGNTFTTPTNVTNVKNGNFSELAITPLEQTTFIAYQDAVSSQVFLTQSQSSQLNFQAPVRVSDANTQNGEARSPAMIADHGGLLHIVWIDTSIIGDQEGLMLYSTTRNGHSFAAPVEILAVVHGPSE